MISILVVEDHQTVAQMIGRFLEKYMDSAKTSIVSSAEAALEMFDGMRPAGEHEAPDIVLVDVSLPKMSGIELVAILHKSFP
ncbi:MAG TPA: response regulator, partial [Candidatus Binatia bacterium]|nr:response regulator [Candidatus Binatia bacterium]